jgi:hypothetical protein
MTGSNERALRANGGRAYTGGVAVAVVTSFLTVWTTIVRDDGSGLSFFMLIMAAAVGAFAAGFRPAGMARTMVGVAIMQALLGVGIATAPVIANGPDGPVKPLLFAGAFAMFWLISALCFRAAAKGSD